MLKPSSLKAIKIVGMRVDRGLLIHTIRICRISPYKMHSECKRNKKNVFVVWLRKVSETTKKVEIPLEYEEFRELFKEASKGELLE